MATHTFQNAKRLAGAALAGVSLACASGSPAALAAEVPEGLGAALIDGYIGPATQGFADAGAAMHVAMQGYCTALASMPARKVEATQTPVERTREERGAVGGTVTTEAAAQEVGRRFSELAQAWARVEFLRFGPLVQDNRFERIFFWPDPRGTVQRRTQATLGSGDQALLKAGALRAASVAIQGLPSLEYALYGGPQALLATALSSSGTSATTPSAKAPPDGVPPDGSAQGSPSHDGSSTARDYRCAYASAVAANVALLATEVAQAWGPGGDMAQRFARPGPENPMYRNPAEVGTEMIKALSGGVHYVRDAKLLPALGATPAEARPAKAPLWRSDITLDTVSAGLRGMAQFYRAAQLQATLAPTDAWLATVVTNGASHIADRLDALDMPLEDALRQTGSRKALTSAVVELNSLKEMIDGQVAGALGINVGFNALDGD